MACELGIWGCGHSQTTQNVAGTFSENEGSGKCTKQKPNSQENWANSHLRTNVRARQVASESLWEAVTPALHTPPPLV